VSDERHQRRLDRILEDDYLGELGERSTDDLRRMREECEEEESGLSYARRIVQGRLDIVRAEALRRRDGGDDVADVLGALPTILGDEGPGSGAGGGRSTWFLVPPHVQYHRRGADTIADEDSMADLGQRSKDDLRELVDHFTRKEHEFSTVRRQLLDRIDAIQTELVERYKNGSTSVADVLVDRSVSDPSAT